MNAAAPAYPVLVIERVLSHLKAEKAWIEPTGHTDPRERWALRRMKNGITLHACFLDEGLLEHMLSLDLIMAYGSKRYVLSRAGHARQKRQGCRTAPFRQQHGVIGASPDALVADAREGALASSVSAPPPLYNFSESPLMWLAKPRGAAKRAWLSGAEFAAGERLRRDFTLAGLEARMGVNWSALPLSASSSGGGEHLSDVMVAARQRVQKALRLLGVEQSGLVLDVCCFLKGLEVVEMERGWPQRSAKVALKIALATLARHYGLSDEAVGAASSGLRSSHDIALDGETH
jgi:Domain of unknown function (DUF6456)